MLGELLHSLIQPLTVLHCSLELSLDEGTEMQKRQVSAALEQAGRAIEVVRLMREYFELEQGPAPLQSVPLAPAVHTVLEQLAVLAQARRVPLLASGTSNAVIHISELSLLRALSYLIGTLVEDERPGSAIAVFLEDRPSRHLLSIHVLPQMAWSSGERRCRPGNVLRRTRLAIAKQVLEIAGASVEWFGEDPQDLIVGIPRSTPVLHELLA
jgi:hypothetical protein